MVKCTGEFTLFSYIFKKENEPCFQHELAIFQKTLAKVFPVSLLQGSPFALWVSLGGVAPLAYSLHLISCSHL